jgi:UDP-N-acetylmuramoyl-L-alanyl-D-glutamate--2,6-diaminopimelate ligase
MEDYFKAKCLLFQKIREGGIALINIDDPYGKRLWEQLKDVDKMSYGFDPEAEGRVLEYEKSFKGMHLKVKALDEIWELYPAIFGEHNIYNILASIGVAYKYSLKKEKVIFGIESFTGVKGRLERVYGSSQLKVFVDYAHTPEALEKVLICLSKLKKGKLWVVFGCGGNRYREKRREMGKIASSIADKVVITTDNPRDENPMQIIDDILEGVLDKDKCEIIPDRRQAIEKVIAEADIDDVVLIAGKGHERFQIIGNLVIPFDDREIASRALIKRTMNELANVM